MSFSKHNINWIHISDLQISSKPSHQSAIMRDELLSDVGKCIKEMNVMPDFIAVTGDITFSNQVEEYELAYKYLLKLLSITGLKKNRLFIIPGNHDVDFSENIRLTYGIKETIENRESINDIISTLEYREPMLRRFKNYEYFINDMIIDHPAFSTENFFYTSILKIAGIPVAIMGLNTEWLALGRRDDYGKLALGESQVTRALAKAEECELKIAMIHHPLDWLYDFDRATTASLLFKECDFILQGHSHHSELSVSQSPNARTLRIASTVSGGSKDSDRNLNYNIISLDMENREGEIYLRSYSERAQFWTMDISSFRNAQDGIYRFSLGQKESVSHAHAFLQGAELTPTKFLVQTIKIENFKGFKSKEFKLNNNFNVFVGKNGSGKTAVLEALKIAIGSFFQGIDGIPAPAIEREQIRVVSHRIQEQVNNEPQFPVTLDCIGCWGDKTIRWKRSRNDLKSLEGQDDTVELAQIGINIQALVRDGVEIVLPVIAYYSTGRIWRMPEAKDTNLKPPGSRFEIYSNCLDPASHLSGLVGWMKEQESISLQTGRHNRIFQSVKKAITDCLPMVKSISFDVSENEIVIEYSDKRKLPFRYLSEGYRNMLAMVADIAYRSAALNPQFGADAALNTPGIVLIDEIDLHLHPEWQKKVVDDLRKVFPKIQFIATTHSPFIIQSLRSGELIDLEPDQIGEYVGKSIEDIAEQVMGVENPQRSQRYQQMYEAALDYYKLLEQAKSATPEQKEKLKQELDRLAAPFSDNVAYYAFLEIERIAADLGGNKDEAS